VAESPGYVGRINGPVYLWAVRLICLLDDRVWLGGPSGDVFAVITAWWY
jgi:hypothetical protein